MKKLFVISFFFILVGANAQKMYKPFFGDSVTTWYEYITPEASLTIKYIVDSDTLIDNIIWKKLNYGQHGSFPPYSEILLREDSTHSKLFLKYDTTGWIKDSNEYMLYDLNLEVNDSIELYSNDTVKTKYAIDTIIFLDSLKHIYIKNTSLVLIEGVGLTSTNLYMANNHVLNFFGYGYGNILCKFKDESKFFEDSSMLAQLRYESRNSYRCDSISECEYSCIGGIEEANTLHVQLFPNPTQRNVNLAIDKAVRGEFKIQIYNAQSQLILEQTIRKNNIQLELEQRGLYFVSVQTENGLNFRSKLVVE